MDKLFVITGLTPGSPWSISVLDNNGCPQTLNGVYNYSPPNPSINGLNNIAYCIGESPTIISGVPGGPGSTFSGPGITDFGNGNANFNPTAAGIGMHTITYNYLSPDGCNFPVTQMVNVTQGAVANITGSGCPNDMSNPITITFNAGMPPYTINLEIDGNPQPPISGIFANPYTFMPTQGGVYTIASFNDSGACQGLGVGSASILPSPSVSILNPPFNSSNLCHNEDLLFNGNASGGSPPYIGHLWTGSGAIYLDDPTSSLPTLNVNPYPSPPVIDLTYTVTDAMGCQQSETLTYFIFETPVADFTITSPSCASGLLFPTPDPLQAPGGIWSMNNGGVIDQTLGIIDLAATGPGSYIVIYTVSNGAFPNCFDTHQIPLVIQASSPATFTQINPICESAMPIPLPANSLEGVPGTWDVGTTLDPTGLGGTTVTINFTPAMGQCASAATMDIVVTSAPTAMISGDATICSGATDLTFTGTPNATVNYSNGVAPFSVVLDATGNATVSVSPLVNTTYSLTTVDLNSCTSNLVGSVTITIGTPTTPTFTAIGPLCQNSTAPILPAMSTNATPIAGTWTPAVISTTTVGTTTYTFTPTAGCAATATMGYNY